MPLLVLATRNQHKVREIRFFLEALGEKIEITDLESYPALGELPEEGATFLENARSKAWQVARFTKSCALADDSGLEVDALGGAPGVYSARFANPTGACDDVANNRKLLQELEGIAPAKRTARYRCVLVLAQPSPEREWSFDGVCEGRITLSPQGAGGFGYDPLFFLPSLGKTMAEISLKEKNQISHRAQALMQLRDALPAILKEWR
jgi:XTP/dITP diphosphohydrolase